MRNLWKVLLVVMMVMLIAGCVRKQNNQNNSAPAQKLIQYTVASEIDYLPMEFVDQSTNSNTGFDIELMQAIGKDEGFEPVFKNMSYDGIANALQVNRVDIGISAIIIQPDIQQTVAFSEPYFETGLIVAVSKDNDTIKGFMDLKGKPLAARVASAGSDKCGEISSDVKNFEHVPDALSSVKNGDAVAMIDSLPITAYYVNQSPNDYKLVGDLLSPKLYGIAVAKNRPELLQKINEGLNKLKANGEYATLYKKWFGRDPEPFLPGQPPQ